MRRLPLAPVGPCKCLHTRVGSPTKHSPLPRFRFAQVLLAAAIMRVRSEAFTWLGAPVSAGWKAVYDACPEPPVALLARAALLRFHPSSLKYTKGAGQTVADAVTDHGMSDKARTLMRKIFGAAPGSGSDAGVPRGLVAPQMIHLGSHRAGSFQGYISPAVSAKGVLYVPRDYRRRAGAAGTGPGVIVFASDGSSCAPIEVVARGIVGGGVKAVAVDDASGALFLVAAPVANLPLKRSARLLALNVARGTRWASQEQFGACHSIAVLPAAAASGTCLVIAAAHSLKELVVYRAADGRIIQRVAVAIAAPVFVACHAVTRSVYVSLEAPHAIAQYVWEGAEFVFRCTLDAAGHGADSRLIAVVPPTPAKCTAHLVIVDSAAARLLVLALPSHVCIHERSLPSSERVVGIAADPRGSAVVMCCRSTARDSAGSLRDSVHVLPWPFDGMPSLD
jgi:hypothetical protein